MYKLLKELEAKVEAELPTGTAMRRRPKSR